jgi:hypothetical protein
MKMVMNLVQWRSGITHQRRQTSEEENNRSMKYIKEKGSSETSSESIEERIPPLANSSENIIISWDESDLEMDTGLYLITSLSNLMHRENQVSFEERGK